MPRSRTQTARLASILSTVILGLLASEAQHLNRQVSAAAVQFLQRSRSTPAYRRYGHRDGPGVYDDYKPLLKRESIRQLSDERRDELETAFQADFRITSKAFRYIIRVLGSDFKTGGGTYTREFAGLAALWHLANGCSYREVCTAMRRNVSEPTVMRYVHRFVDCVSTKLKGHISFPDQAGLAENEAAFKLRSGIPGIIGAIDGCHIPVHPSPEQAERYYNYKNFYSVILSGIVDARGRFISVNAGYFGRLGDSGCLQHSPIWNATVHGELFSNAGYCLYGDSAYPLQRWLLKGYADSSSNLDQRKFNTRGSKARVIVECAYGKLKGQWRTLHVGLRTEAHDIWVNTIHTCCILHNITIDFCEQGWSLEDDFGNGIRSGGIDALDSDPHAVVPGPGAVADDVGAKIWRDHLLDHLKSLPDW